MSAQRDRHGQPMYGGLHKAVRRRFAARMRVGEVFHCWRPSGPTPGEPINPRTWDLGHVDPELWGVFGHRHPEHPQCNRRTVNHLKDRLKAAEGREPHVAGVVISLDDHATSPEALRQGPPRGAGYVRAHEAGCGPLRRDAA